MTQDRGGYRAAFGHPVARRLWLASAVSVVGDYVAQGALLLLAYERSGGRLVAPSALFAIQAVPALLSGSLAGSWLDQVPRRTALAWLQVTGAASLALPLTVGGLLPVLAAAALLGGVRAAHIAVRSGAVAEGVPDPGKGPLLALFGATDQAAQVVGYLTGASIAVAVGPAVALLFDAATFVLAALVVATVTLPPPRPRRTRPPTFAGLAAIWRDPVLRLVALLVWVTATVTAVPETLAPGVTGGDGRWTPLVMAAGPAGQVLAMAYLGRRAGIVRPSFQLSHLAWLALAFGLAALGGTPAWFVVGNLLVGSGVAWLLGPQTLFVRLAPAEQMAQITGTMLAVIIAAEGLGTVALAALADATSVSGAYRAAGALVLATAVAGWVVKEWTPAARALDETP